MGGQIDAAIVIAAWMFSASMVIRKAPWINDFQCHCDSRYTIDPCALHYLGQACSRVNAICEVTQGWTRIHTLRFFPHWFSQDSGYSLSKSSLNLLKS